jgi:hypothetical protein
LAACLSFWRQAEDVGLGRVLRGVVGARIKRDAAKKLLASGVDPSHHAKVEKSAAAERHGNTFSFVDDEFLKKVQREGKSDATVGKKRFEPAQSPFLTTGHGGPHQVEGTGGGFEPPFLDRSRLKEVRTVDQRLAFDMCRRLAREEGIFGGTSTGMNVVGAIQLATELGRGKRIVTLGCDNGIKYLGGPLFA